MTGWTKCRFEKPTLGVVSEIVKEISLADKIKLTVRDQDEEFCLEDMAVTNTAGLDV